MPVPITVLTCRGISEPFGNNMLTRVTRQLDPARFKVIEIPWSATIGPVGGSPTSPSLMASMEQAVQMLDQHTTQAPGPVVTLGYSGGACSTTEHLARNRGNGKIILAGNIANPRRKAGKSYGLPSFGEGIFGRPIDDKRQWAEIAFPGDVMTSMPSDSPLRQGSSLIEWMSLADPIRWATDVIGKLPAVQSQLLGGGRMFDLRFWQAFPEAISLLDAYARGGAHTLRYGEKHWRDWRGQPITGIDLLARCVNGVKA